MAIQRHTSDAGSKPTPRGMNASLNSISSRIILCVFCSTLLTALIVSGFSIRSIHQDVRRQAEQRAEAVLAPRSAELGTLLAEATTELAVATSPGTPWHRALLDASDDVEGSSRQKTTLVWQAPRLDNSEASPLDEPRKRYRALPEPPLEIRPLFDQVRLVLDADTASENRPWGDTGGTCLAAEVDLFRESAPIVGRLEGCLDREFLLTLLHSDSRQLRGMRVLLVDPKGRIRESAGVRGAERLGTAIPSRLTRTSPTRRATLNHYVDGKQTALVGLSRRIPKSHWSLLVEAEHADAFAPALALTQQIIGIDICIILAFSLLAQRVARALMAPIEALSEGAQRIAAGNVDYQIPAPENRTDELGRLTDIFNQMMAKLRSNQQIIEEDRFRLEEKNDELQHANEILAQLSITDGLTNLHNHRYFQDHLTREIKRVGRTNAPLSLILLDIDDFKLLNDTHGHAAGDEVLVSLAAIMNDSARESDLIARYGGEEFVVLMPGTDLAGAVHLAEKIRMAVESTRLIIGENMRPVNVTVSVGVALYSGDRRNLFVEADKALYEAKDAGKNCVVIAGSS